LDTARGRTLGVTAYGPIAGPRHPGSTCRISDPSHVTVFEGAVEQLGFVDHAQELLVAFGIVAAQVVAGPLQIPGFVTDQTILSKAQFCSRQRTRFNSACLSGSFGAREARIFS
jgi:hypothetical protein